MAVGHREVIRSKAVRKIAEHWDASALINMEIGPWDLKRGLQTIAQQSKPADQPLPRLRASRDGVEADGDVDEKAVLQYALEHPDDDKDDAGDVQAGGAQLPQESHAPQELQAVDENIPMMSDEEWNQIVNAQVKRDREQELRLPIPVRQRVAEAEATKRATDKEVSTQAKFVKFDHTNIEQPKSKQPRTEMFSSTFAGEISGSSSTTKGHVRLITEEIELYEEDIPEETVPLESWDWDVNDQLLEGDYPQFEIPVEEKRKRGFHSEDAGPPEVTAEELAFLDKQAMYAELDRLRKLDVICDVQTGVDVTQASHLDTELVRDWRFRQGCLDQACENGSPWISGTKCFNRGNFQSYNTFDDGESFDGHCNGETLTHVSLGCERCFPSSSTT